MHGHLPSGLMQITRVLPLAPIEMVAQRLVANAIAARPGLTARLGACAGLTFTVDPTDCPFVFLITPGGRTSLRLRRQLDGAHYAARIAAPLVILLGLLDGTYDGDALFFSRDLVIEGDTEAVLALRNAIEDAELDPATVMGLPGPLKKTANHFAETMLDGLRRMLHAPPPSGSRRGTIPS